MAKGWKDRLFGLLRTVLFYGYGLFTLLLYAFLAVRRGTFFKRSTKKEKFELFIAQDRLWNLSKDYFGLSHHFVTLKDGFKFHYLSNHSDNGASDPTSKSKPLVLFIHGFPDSWAIWRSIVSSESLQNSAILVAVDLPGFGGSAQLDKYTATNVLGSLTEFIFAVRVKYGVDTETDDGQQKKVVVVGHDWGCVLAMRLAAEAPQLADRFILTNGPLPSLVVSNCRRRLSSAWKMIRTSGRFPLRSRRSTILKALKTVVPIFRQVILSGYIFAFQLPMPLVRYLGYGGNYSFLKGVHQASCGGDGISPIEAAECMASTLGPSGAECKTKTNSGDAYPVSTRNSRSAATFEHMTSYYRDGAVRSRWVKSIETIAHLHSLDRGIDSRRSSSGAGVFDDGPEGLLKANSTIIWGKADIALEPHLCLDGISDYLVFNSQVVVLPRSGHFTPVERESRLALEKAVEWAVKGEKEDIGAVLQACYSGATLAVRR